MVKVINEMRGSFDVSANAGKIAMVDEPRQFNPFELVTLRGGAAGARSMGAASSATADGCSIFRHRRC
eukprot:gene17880-33018_t